MYNLRELIGALNNKPLYLLDNMAENQGQDGDLIFTETDPSFNLVRHALSELYEQNRMSTLHVQIASIQDIESANRLFWLRLKFGGLTLPGPHAFGRTASAVIRMCMLKATKVESQHWPVMSGKAHKRNSAKLKYDDVYHASSQEFILADNKLDARAYWSKYDHLYPHFLIEDKMSGEIGVKVRMTRMMVIIRNEFKEAVELTTTFEATPRADKRFNSKVRVTCVVRQIVDRVGVADKKHTKALKEMMSIPTISIEPYPETIPKEPKDPKTEEERKVKLVSVFDKNLVIKSEDN